MKKNRLLVLISCTLCAIAACALLASCGTSTPKGSKDMVGYWELEGGISDGVELSAEDVEYMASLDVRLILHLAEDGTATVDLFGDVADGTWDYEKATMAIADSNGDLELSDGKLTFGDGGSNKLVFKKGDDSLATKIEADRKAAQ